ncbi:MAG: type II secretion system major pseudopilin GspG [Thermodesulfobacteriota bacterium]
MQQNKMLRDNRGFTIMEIMIVIIIIGLMATFAAPQFIKQLGKAERNTAKAQVEMLMTALDAYRLDVGSYPSQQEGLEALVANPGSDGWLGPYLKKTKIPDDPWGHPYLYQSPGQQGEVDISSLGADNKEGGDGKDADINSWE